MTAIKFISSILAAPSVIIQFLSFVSILNGQSPTPIPHLLDNTKLEQHVWELMGDGGSQFTVNGIHVPKNIGKAAYNLMGEEIGLHVLLQGAAAMPGAKNLINYHDRKALWLDVIKTIITEVEKPQASIYAKLRALGFNLTEESSHLINSLENVAALIHHSSDQLTAIPQYASNVNAVAKLQGISSQMKAASGSLQVLGALLEAYNLVGEINEFVLLTSFYQAIEVESSLQVLTAMSGFDMWGDPAYHGAINEIRLTLEGLKNGQNWRAYIMAWNDKSAALVGGYLSFSSAVAQIALAATGNPLLAGVVGGITMVVKAWFSNIDQWECLRRATLAANLYRDGVFSSHVNSIRPAIRNYLLARTQELHYYYLIDAYDNFLIFGSVGEWVSSLYGGTDALNFFRQQYGIISQISEQHKTNFEIGAFSGSAIQVWTVDSFSVMPIQSSTGAPTDFQIAVSTIGANAATGIAKLWIKGPGDASFTQNAMTTNSVSPSNSSYSKSINFSQSGVYEYYFTVEVDSESKLRCPESGVFYREVSSPPVVVAGWDLRANSISASSNVTPGGTIIISNAQVFNASNPGNTYTNVPWEVRLIAPNGQEVTNQRKTGTISQITSTQSVNLSVANMQAPSTEGLYRVELVVKPDTDSNQSNNIASSDVLVGNFDTTSFHYVFEQAHWYRSFSLSGSSWAPTSYTFPSSPTNYSLGGLNSSSQAVQVRRNSGSFVSMPRDSFAFFNNGAESVFYNEVSNIPSWTVYLSFGARSSNYLSTPLNLSKTAVAGGTAEFVFTTGSDQFSWRNPNFYQNQSSQFQSWISNVSRENSNRTVRYRFAIPGSATPGEYRTNILMEAGTRSILVENLRLDVKAAPPSLASVTPNPAEPGATVTLTGTAFGSAGTLTLGGVAVTTSSWSNTQIRFVLPSNATSGDVRVTASGGSSNAVFLNVQARPRIAVETLAGVVLTGITLGTIELGQEAAMQVRLRNSGSAPLLLGNFQSSPAGQVFWALQDSGGSAVTSNPVQVAAGGHLIATVRAQPSQRGAFSGGSFRFDSSDPDRTSVDLPVTANVVDTTPPVIQVISPSFPSGETIVQTATVTGWVTDQSTVSMTYKLNNGVDIAVTLDGDSFQIGPVTWVQGANSLALKAVDAANNTKTETLTVTYIQPATLTLAANPAEGGTVYGGGNFKPGAAVTAMAEAAEGYFFAGWREGTTLVSSLPMYSFNLNSDRTLTGTFIPLDGTALVPEALTVTGEGQAYPLSVFSTQPWQALSDADWAVLNGQTTGAGNGTLTVTVTTNPSALHSRTALITAGGQTHTLTQLPGPLVVSLDPAVKSTHGEPHSYTIGVTANGVWSAESNQNWAVATPSAGSGNGVVTVTVEENPSKTTSRTATIVIGGQIHELTQAPRPVPPALVRWDFTGQPGNQANTPGAAVASGVLAVSITRGSSLSAASSSGSMSASNWPSSSTTRGANAYYEFGVTFDELHGGDLRELHFGESRSSSSGSPRKFMLTSSLDGHAAAIGGTVYDLPTGTAQRDQSIELPAEFRELTGTIVFRLYAYSASSSSGQWRLLNPTGMEGMTLAGTVRRLVNVTLDPTEMLVDAAAQNYTIRVTGTGTWSATSDQPWATLQPGSGNGDGEVTVTVQANTATGISRSALLTIGGKVHSLSQVALPAVVSPESTNLTANTASLGGDVTSDGGALITERGVVYSITSTNNNPLIGGSGVTKVTASGTTGSFSVPVPSLTAGTDYSFKAYATNSAGTTYTSPVSTFTTLPAPTAPVVSSPVSSSVTMTTATLSGSISSDGGTAITERGVVYSVTTTNNNPLIGGSGVTKVTASGTTGSFSVPVTGLIAGTGYSFNAYATNSVGTTYSTPVSTFSTLPALTAPAVALSTSSNITTTTATLGGSVTSDGGSAITERGVVYSVTSTNNNPLIGGSGVSKVTTSGTTGSFAIPVTGLDVGTDYSFKAYATNSVGTSYTTPVSTFSTLPTLTAPVLALPTSSSITMTTATLGGTVSSDGGTAITERGVVYSVTTTNNNPLIGGSDVTRVTATGTTGSFTIPVTGLTAETGYSFKAYATNSVGTTYTTPVSTFTTLETSGNPVPLYHYTFDETLAEKNALLPNAGTSGSISYVDGARGKALRLNEFNSYGTLPAVDFSAMSSTTVAGWVKEEALSNFHGTYFFFWGDERDTFKHLGFGHFQELLGFGPVDAWVPYESSWQNVWTHFAMVHTETSSALFVNGIKVKEVSQTGSKWKSNAAGYIGGHRNSQYGNFLTRFQGAVDELMVFDRALGDGEVMSLVNPITPILSLSPESRQHSAVPATGETFSVESNVNWTASVTSGSEWLTLTSGSSGNGAGQVSYSLLPNGGSESRQGTILVTTGDLQRTFTVTQSPVPSLTISPTSRTQTASASSNRSITVTANVEWTAVRGPDSQWLTVTSGSSGTGNGSVLYSIAANSTFTSRVGTIVISGGGIERLHTVTQSGLSVTLTLSSDSKAYGAESAEAQTLGISCNTDWNANIIGDAAWIQIEGQSTGTGNGTLGYRLAANDSGIDRLAILQVTAGSIVRDFMVKQLAGSFEPGMLLHLPFNGDYVDVSGTGQSVLGTNITYGEDRHGNPSGAVRFNNTSASGTSRVTVSHRSDLNPAAYTLAMWVKPSSNGYNSQFGHDWVVLLRKGTNYPYGMFLDKANLRSFAGVYNGAAGTGDSVLSPAPHQLNQWHHLAATYQSGVCKLYVNGLMVAETNQAGALPANSESISIGSGSFSAISSAFEGWMDDIRLYSAAMSAADIAGLAGINETQTYAYFLSNESGNSQLWRGTLEVGGISNQQQLTDIAAPGRVDFFKLDPVRNRIGLVVFSGTQSADGLFYWMNPDGTGLSQVSGFPVSGPFAYSPDHSEIVIAKGVNSAGGNVNEAYRMNLTTGATTLLLAATEPRGTATHKTWFEWLSDGRILFADTRVFSDYAGQHDLHLWDNGVITSLASNTAQGDATPLLSPDRTKLLVSHYAAGGGTHQMAYIQWPTDTGRTVILPWSNQGPLANGWLDNETVLFQEAGELYSIKLDGTQRSNLTNTPGVNEFYLQVWPGGTASQTERFEVLAAAAGLIGSDALPQATPHRDGVENLLKFAFNMDLSGPDRRGMVRGTGTAGLPDITSEPSGGPMHLFRFEFLRRKDSGLVYTPKKSSSLGAGSWLPLTDTPDVIPIDANWERVIYEEPYDPAVTPRCFGTVEVSMP